MTIRYWRQYFLLISIWSNLAIPTATMTSCVGEGCGTAVGTTEAVDNLSFLEHHAAKEHGQRPKIESKRRTTKRSFKRAFNRSIRDGFTMYHGKIFTPQDFNLPIPTSTPQVKLSPRVSPCPPSGASNRLSVFSWNCGGLSSEKYQCLQAWLLQHQFDIVCLQESHWRFTRLGKLNSFTPSIQVILAVTLAYSYWYPHVYPLQIPSLGRSGLLVDYYMSDSEAPLKTWTSLHVTNTYINPKPCRTE